MEGSLSKGERQRLAALAAATANALLVMFVLAVALPLLPAKLADPFWLLAFTGAFCSNGFLALMAVLLLHVAAALEPQSLALAPLARLNISASCCHCRGSGSTCWAAAGCAWVHRSGFCRQR